jgi:hypothetical protein
MELFKSLISTIETATAGGTAAGDIADVRSRLGEPKKKKKMKGHGNNPLYVDRGSLFRSFVTGVKETASPATTNVVDFSNDFGTDTPRLPSEFGSLDGRKSLGMFGGTDVISLELFNAFIEGAQRRDFYKSLNQHGLDEEGLTPPADSTTHDPIAVSPWDAYVPSQEFILKQEQEKLDKEETRAASSRERERRENGRELTDSMQKAYVGSIQRAAHADDPDAIGHAQGAKKHHDDYGDTDRTVGKDEKKF